MTTTIAKEKVKTYQDLNVYQSAFKLANEIFELTKKFPKEETYSLIDQIRRSSRSIVSNIGEGWAKRKYENIFLRHLNDSNGSCEETKIWLDFALQCNYITAQQHAEIRNRYNQVGAMLHSLLKKWKTF